MAGERTDAAKAATVYNQLVRIDDEEREELAASPATISKKHEERRKKLKEKTDRKVWRKAEAMLLADVEEEPTEDE